MDIQWASIWRMSKSQNRSSILKLLNDHGPMSRKDISARLGLTPASVTTLCAELLAQNILVELGEVQQGNRAGRRKILLGINYTYRYVLSISIEMPSTCITLCDLRGEHCSTRRIPTDIAAPPELFLKQVANVGKALLWENSIGREQLLGAGVSVPGPVDREKGVSTTPTASGTSRCRWRPCWRRRWSARSCWKTTSRHLPVQN